MECAASFIRRDSPRYAEALIAEVKATAQSPKRFSNRGRLVPQTETPAIRELFVKNYRLIYESRDTDVVILALIHGVRKFPSYLRP